MSCGENVRPVGKRIPDVEPGKAQVIKFAAKIFEPGPDEWEQHDSEPAELQPAQARQRDEPSEPEGQDGPERHRRPAKKGPEECQVRRINRVADRQPGIERLARRGKSGELKKTVQREGDQKTQRWKS